VLIQQISICPTCHGRGKLIDAPCPECAGSGEVSQSETLTVNIPAGIEEGTALRVPGHGRASRMPHCSPGDLLIVVRSAPDARFARDGADLWQNIAISPADAALGAELDVPTLTDLATVTVPAGTQPDTVLRLRGKGLPLFGGHGHGNLYLRIVVHVPETLSDDERALYQQLRTLTATANPHRAKGTH
jgi:molecular chaperone DnaJ